MLPCDSSPSSPGSVRADGRKDGRGVRTSFSLFCEVTQMEKHGKKICRICWRMWMDFVLRGIYLVVREMLAFFHQCQDEMKQNYHQISWNTKYSNWNLSWTWKLNLLFLILTFMHQSIPPVPIPPGQPRGICSGTLSREWGICAPRGLPPPRELDTRGFKTVKSTGRRYACFVPSWWRLLWEKIRISRHSS